MTREDVLSCRCEWRSQRSTGGGAFANASRRNPNEGARLPAEGPEAAKRVDFIPATSVNGALRGDAKVLGRDASDLGQ
jgi:hypothetical protein